MKKILLIYSVSTTIIIIAVLTWNKIKDQLFSHYKIVMFGDSLTDGWNDVSYLRKSDVKISGNPGFTTSHFLFILDNEVIKYKPDTCYIEGGINDIGVGIPLTRTKKNYKERIDTLKANSIVPIIQSTLYKTTDAPENKYVDSLNDYLATLCTSQYVKFID